MTVFIYSACFGYLVGFFVGLLLMKLEKKIDKDHVDNV